jgi:DNA-binding transcriptional LysR family regulator
MDRLESMSVLLAVVAAGSLSGASKQLRMPLPTVSRKVSELEVHLGARLLVRSTRKLALTEAGESYVAACRRILEDVDEAEHRAASHYSVARGVLVLTAPVVLGRMHVVPVVAQFLDAFPEVDVRLMLADRALDLIDEHLDLAVRVGALPDSGLLATAVGRIRSVVCGTPAYFAQRGTPREPADLARHACVTFAALDSPERWTLNAANTVQVHSRLVVNTAEAAIDAALAGVGVTRVLSYQVAELVRAGRLVTVLQEHEPPSLPVNLVRGGGARLTAKLRAFLDFASPRLRARLGSADGAADATA